VTNLEECINNKQTSADLHAQNAQLAVMLVLPNRLYHQSLDGNRVAAVQANHDLPLSLMDLFMIGTDDFSLSRAQTRMHKLTDQGGGEAMGEGERAD
jgi:hypothetical protein